MHVHVSAPSRLHFGLSSFDREDVPQYGGVGAMICEPRVELTIQNAGQLSLRGPSAERAEAFARAAAEHWRLTDELRCEIEILAAPPAHNGLGSGTQLALSVAAGLRACLELPPQSEMELAASVGRGGRSSIGVFGFIRGGFIVDAGHTSGEPLGRLEMHVPLPEAWRFVLVRAPGPAGRSGSREQRAFANLPPVTLEVTDRLNALAAEYLAPSAADGVFDTFSDAVFEYGRLAGECFAACQGGPFATPSIAELVETLRRAGVRGVGQSSWGPTVFALARDEDHATQIGMQLQRDPLGRKCDVTITEPCNSGARIVSQAFQPDGGRTL